MKLYATITSERASKGQGGNERLTIDIMNEEQKIIAYLHAIPTDGKPVLGFFPSIKDVYVVTSHEEFRAITEQQRKGKKQKGEWCEICGNMKSSECEYHDFVPE